MLATSKKPKRYLLKPTLSLYRHLKAFEEWTDNMTNKKAGLRQREDQGRFWWELRSSRYYDTFDQGYIAYQDIAFNSAFEIKRAVFPELTAFCLPTICPVLLATLNSPVMWYFMSRAMLHGKDQALRLKTDKMQFVPIPYRARERQDNLCHEITADLSRITRQIKESDICILDWLRHEFGLDKPDAALAQLGLPRRFLPRGFRRAPGCGPPQTIAGGSRR
jgi:hypothetical protein